MGFPWKKIGSGIKGGAQLGAALGLPFAKQLIQAIHIVELIPGLKGSQKKEAAKLIAVELVGDKGLMTTDKALAALVDQFIDLYVAIMNRVAELKAKDDNDGA